MSIYREIDGLRYTMEKLHESGEKDQFPHAKGNLIESFKYIEEYMNANCHPNTTVGAAANGDGLLTDHGVDHVKMVIENEAKLVGDMQYRKLNGYEIYLLLLATHFHDIGNIRGRQEHEKQIDDIIAKLGNHFPLDAPEKMIVSDIAMSHGGYVDETHTDKDTLRLLKPIDNCNGIIIRPALLGALLRFADELSDDNTRSSRYMDDANAIPPDNRIYHAYSSALSPIAYSGNTIVFKYYIPFEQVQNRIPDADGTFLYDEIIRRLGKCMLELEYCSKYSEGFIRVTTLSAEINVMHPVTVHRPVHSTKFSLRLSGYPETFKIPNGLLDFKTGEALSEYSIAKLEKDKKDEEKDKQEKKEKKKEKKKRGKKS